MSDYDDIEEEGPTEDDLQTSDHENFYQYGRLALEVPRGSTTAQMWRAIDRWMESKKLYPSVWFISDHGNAHLMERPKKRARGKGKKSKTVIDATHTDTAEYLGHLLAQPGWSLRHRADFKRRLRALSGSRR